jgi:hypothetical protein
MTICESAFNGWKKHPSPHRECDPLKRNANHNSPATQFASIRKSLGCISVTIREVKTEIPGQRGDSGNEIVYSSGHNKWSCVTAGLEHDCHGTNFSFSSFNGGNSNTRAKHSGEFYGRRPYRLDRRLVVRGERRRANFCQRGPALPNGGLEAARHR